MSHLDELISLFLGLFTPIAVSYWKGNTWSPRQSFLLSLLISTIVGAFSSIGTHALVFHEAMTLDDWAANALVVFSAATATYKLYFENTQLNDTLEEKGPFSKPGGNG